MLFVWARRSILGSQSRRLDSALLTMPPALCLLPLFSADDLARSGERKAAWNNPAGVLKPPLLDSWPHLYPHFGSWAIVPPPKSSARARSLAPPPLARSLARRRRRSFARSRVCSLAGCFALNAARTFSSHFWPLSTATPFSSSASRHGHCHGPPLSPLSSTLPVPAPSDLLSASRRSARELA